MIWRRKIWIGIILMIASILFACTSDVQKINQDALQLIKDEAYGQALDLLNDALTIDPSNSITWNNISLCYDALGEYQPAVDAALKAIEFGGANEIIYANLGNAYFDLGELEAAKHAYEKSIEFNPDYFYALYGMGVYYTEEKNYQEALPYFINLYDTNAFDVGVVKYITFCKYKLGEIDDAIRFLERELDRVSDEELEALLEILYDFNKVNDE